jgi:triphosphatase
VTTRSAGPARKTARPTIPVPPAPQKAVAPALSALMPPAPAFAEIARSCLVQLTANAAGALAGDDPEYVHQMRVALRRLRSALRMFAPHLAGDFFEQARPELQWLAALLGSARDWDVLAGQTLPRIFGAHPPRLAGTLERTLQGLIAERRAAGRAAIRKALAGRRYKSLLRQWEHALAALEAGHHQGGRLPGFAARVLARADQPIHLRHGALVKMSVARRHRYRIATKRLRYAVDFFAPLFSGKRAKRYAGMLADLQDHLGLINDNAVALSLIATLPVTAGAFGIVQRTLEPSSAEALDEAQAAAQKLGRAHKFWIAKAR